MTRSGRSTTSLASTRTISTRLRRRLLRGAAMAGVRLLVVMVVGVLVRAGVRDKKFRLILAGSIFRTSRVGERRSRNLGADLAGASRISLAGCSTVEDRPRVGRS